MTKRPTLYESFTGDMHDVVDKVDAWLQDKQAEGDLEICSSFGSSYEGRKMAVGIFYRFKKK